MQAVFGGNKHEVESLLSKGADPNAFPIMVIMFITRVMVTNNSHFYAQIDFSPLMEASKAGNADIACLLLRKGANPNFANDVSVIIFPFHFFTNRVCIFTGRSDCTNCCNSQ